MTISIFAIVGAIDPTRYLGLDALRAERVSDRLRRGDRLGRLHRRLSLRLEIRQRRGRRRKRRRGRSLHRVIVGSAEPLRELRRVLFGLPDQLLQLPIQRGLLLDGRELEALMIDDRLGLVPELFDLARHESGEFAAVQQRLRFGARGLGLLLLVVAVCVWREGGMDGREIEGTRLGIMTEIRDEVSSGCAQNNRY
jgi:hypothetical protein